MRVNTLTSDSQALRRDAISRRIVVATAAVCVVVVGLALSAYARIPLPFSPVPLTLQTCIVLVAGAGLGRRLGTASVAAYVLLGALGVPVFTTPWLGATAGYLLGFVAAAWLIGELASGGPRASRRRLVLAMAAGSAVIYAFGVTWLAFGLGLGLPKAIAVGVLPYLFGDAAKLLAAVAVCHRYGPRLRAWLR